MGVVLREATVEDLDVVVVLDQEYQPNPWPRYGFARALELKQNFKVVVENGEDGEIILGYGISDGGHGRLIFARTMQAAGLLYRDWFRDAREKGATELTAQIEPSNTAARHRLERFGFQIKGERPHFYGVGKHAQVWSKKLPAEGEKEQGAA
jgi:ribosomal protein S18 acetylase RimI-like enzyme